MFKDNLIQLRKLRSMTQEDVAEKVGVSNVNLSKMKTGKISAIRFPRFESTIQASSFLNPACCSA